MLNYAGEVELREHWWLNWEIVGEVEYECKREEKESEIQIDEMREKT